MKNKIAIFGRSGSGKDYVTQQLHFRSNIMGYWTGSFRRFAFADKVKENVQTILGIPDTEFEQLLHDENYKNCSLIDLSRLRLVAKSDTERRHPGWENLISSKSLSQLRLEYDELTNSDKFMSLREFLVYYGTYVGQRLLGRRVWCNALFNSDEYRQAASSDNALIVVTDVRFPHEFQACREEGFSFLCVESPTEDRSMSNVAESFVDEFEAHFTFHNDKNDTEGFQNEMGRLMDWVFVN